MRRAGPGWAIGPLSLIPAVAREAASVYVRHLGLLAILAVVVFGLADLAEVALGRWADLANRDLAGHHYALFLVDVVPALLPGLLSAFAEVLFAGTLDYVVAADAHGQPSPPLRAIFRRIPYWRLVLTDLALLGITAVGLLLLVLPGLAAWALLGLAGPLVVAEDLSPRRAVRRSFQLLRPRIGAAIGLVLLPTLASSALGDWLAGLVHGPPLGIKVAVELGLDATIFAYAGLLLAVLAHTLVAAPVSPPPR